MSTVHQFLLDQPVALLFLVVGLGYLVGKIRFGSLDLGPVSGVLFAGLVFGHYGLQISPTVQTTGFVLFIFSVGIQAGPRFFSVLRADGLRYLALAVVIGGTGFALAVVLAKVLGFEFGSSAGLLAGGLTTSPTLAAAQEALRAGQVPVPDGVTADEAITNVTTSYAITYLFGLVGLILIIRVLPKILRIDFKAEAQKLAARSRGGVEDEVHVLRNITVRAHRLTNPEMVGRTLGEVLEALPGRMSVEKLRRGGEFLPVTSDVKLELGDEVCLVGFHEEFVGRRGQVGPELSDPELLDTTLESVRIVPLRKKLKSVSTTLGRITAKHGVFVSRIQRLGVDIPLQGDIRIQAGDVVHVTGPSTRVRAVGEAVGRIERATEETDLITFGLGIAAGTVIGTFSIEVLGVSIGLGSAGGLLTAGLVIGYLRAIYPVFGRMPSAARWIFMELGLLVFMAGVGLRAGSGVLEALATSGLSLLAAGAVVTTVPVLVGYAFGRHVLGINPVLLFGAITGSMTSAAALSMVNREAGNSLPALGYTGAYAFANVLLTVAGSVILLF
jgi:putative transport protein